KLIVSDNRFIVHCNLSYRIGEIDLFSQPNVRFDDRDLAAFPNDDKIARMRSDAVLSGPSQKDQLHRIINHGLLRYFYEGSIRNKRRVQSNKCSRIICRISSKMTLNGLIVSHESFCKAANL